MKPGTATELRLTEAVMTAAELESEPREAYLQDLALEELELAEAVRQRLEAVGDLTDSFLETPAATRLQSDSVEPATLASAAAMPVEERYDLGPCLGKGGMGRVFEAFDRQLERTVALKLLTHEDPDIVRSFLAEARAQARIRHEHVLEIYDNGELDGHPFISMQRVTAGTLEDIEAELSLEAKVRLLIQAAEGLHAAHREGLLHGDVKPSNVLVDRTADGELKALVTDFGLAVELNREGGATTDSAGGTPQYIAPERLVVGGSTEHSVIDRRADVYSLGMMLYRLLTGRLPFPAQNTLQVLRQVVESEPPPPRQVISTLPSELEAIILCCIARAPEQRYTSARAVAADLQRYLDGEIVEAYTAGLAYRLTRFAVRHRLLVGMGALALAVLVVSSVVIAVLAWRVDVARQRAEARQQQAEELIRFMVVDLHDKLDDLRRLDILDDVGDAAVKYFAAVPPEELSEDELLRRSRMLCQIGQVRITQGDVDGAAGPMAESLALAERLSKLWPDDNERLFELGQAYFWVGYVAWQRGDLAAARSPLEAYLEISKQVVAREPSNQDWQRELAHAHSNLGSLLEAEGDLEGALEEFRTTLTLDQQLVASDPAPDARADLAAAHNTVGVLLLSLGRLEEAGEHLHAELGIRRALVEETSEDPRSRDFLGASHGQVGIHSSMLGDWSAAREHFLSQRDIFTDLVAYDQANTSWRFKLTWSHLELTRTALAQDDQASATAALQNGCWEIDSLLDLDPLLPKWRWTRAVCLHHRALLQRRRGDAGARGTALEAVRILEGVAAQQPRHRLVHRWLSKSLLLLGSFEGESAAAESAFERAESSIAAFARESRDPRLVAPWVAACSCLGRLDGAEPARARLAALAYNEPGLEALCPWRTGS